MREQVRLHEDLTKKLAEECKAVAMEAQTFRPVVRLECEFTPFPCDFTPAPVTSAASGGITV
eukprot:762159-Pyramimonas_sp.AAC.1